MKHKGFTFIELLLVIICIAILVTGTGFFFKRAKISHMANTFVQELVILKTAIETYYESHGTLPTCSGRLSSFDKLKKPYYGICKRHSNGYQPQPVSDVIPHHINARYIKNELIYVGKAHRRACFSNASNIKKLD